MNIIVHCTNIEPSVNYRAYIFADFLQQWGLHNQTRSERGYIFHNKQRTSSRHDKTARYTGRKIYQDAEQRRFLR